MTGLPATHDPRLVVGPETSDDAGAYRLDDGRLLLQTIDVITPIVDDPATFGAIAAANALSDIYAMGGEPLTVLNFLTVPTKDFPIELGRKILRGSADKVAEAGAMVVGGHTLDDPEVKMGLAVTGLVDEQFLTPNSGARPGDVLILTKALGTGVVSTALKKGKIDSQSAPYRAMVDSMTKLNRAAKDAAREAGARGVTDITGFGLGGHALEMAIASNVSLEIRLADLPLLPDVFDLLRHGCQTGGGGRSAAWYANKVAVPEAWVPVVFDPQTSGGLLIACPEASANRVCKHVASARVIGRVLEPREPRLCAI